MSPGGHLCCNRLLAIIGRGPLIGGGARRCERGSPVGIPACIHLRLSFLTTRVTNPVSPKGGIPLEKEPSRNLEWDPRVGLWREW